jgi:hypothetical protein
MNTGEESTVLYCLFFLIALASLVSWFMIGLVYLLGDRMSLPPGVLISSQAFSYFVNLLLVSSYSIIRLVAELNEAVSLDPEFCEFEVILTLYSRALCLSYDLGVSIELGYKVSRPHANEYRLPLAVYHIFSQAVALTIALEKHFEASFSWQRGQGCVFDQSELTV